MIRAILRPLPLLALACLFASNALAQQNPPTPPNLALGDAVVTGFSGTTAKPANNSRTLLADRTFINPDGASARVIKLGQPGFVWDGRRFAAPKDFDARAKDVGQVFGVALDGQTPPNIYLAATSAFGLNIVARNRAGTIERRKTGGPGAVWMDGQFGNGLQGDPGSIYRIDGKTGAVTLFAKVALDGVPNPGPALGALAYDAAHQQVFVSDLYTGMIHRFAVATGAEAGAHYDHGVTGRGVAKLAPMAFNPANRPNIASPRFNAENPDTWGFAPPERRVWALALQSGRLFYSVGNGSTKDGPQIWSVGIARDGGFANDARLEAEVPAQPGPYPVSDIAFSQKGAMIVAQRAPISASYDYSAFTRAGEPRVLRFWLKDRNDPPSPGRWKPQPEEYAVGFAGNYRNSNGGVAFGYGYGVTGAVSTGTCEVSLWATAQNMRNAPALRSELEPGGPLVLHGLFGIPSSPVRNFNEPPRVSYSVPYADTPDAANALGHLGGVRTYVKPCAAPVAYGGPGYPATPPFIVTIVRPPCIGQNCSPPPDCRPNCPTDNTTDIGIAKIGEVNLNNPDGAYNFTIGVKNLGGAITNATTLTFSDVVPAGMTFTNVTWSPEWTCTPTVPLSGGTTLMCNYVGSFPISANQAMGWVAIVADGGNGPYTNCASLDQTDGNSSNDKACVDVQKDKGNVTVAKEIINQTDPVISTTGLQFPVTVTCGSSVTNLNLIDGLPQTIGNIPFGTTCQLQELSKPTPTGVCANGQPPIWAPETYVPPTQQAQVVSGTTAIIRVQNTLTCGPSISDNQGYILVKKEVISSIQGYSAPATTYPVTYTCSNGTSGTLNLSSDGTAQSIGGLAINTSCTISETTPTTNACPGGQTVTWVTPPPQTASANLPGPTVTVTNRFDCKPSGPGNDGYILVKKEVISSIQGYAAPAAIYPVTYSCSNGTSGTLNLSSDGTAQSIGNLAISTSCTITEATPTTNACPGGQTVTWITPAPQTASANLPGPTVTVTNSFRCSQGGDQKGTLTVNKIVTNRTDPHLAIDTSTLYPISVSCQLGSSPANVTPMPLPDGGSQTIGNLDYTTQCHITETPPGPPTFIAVSCKPGYSPVWTQNLPADVTISSPNATATVENILDCKPSGPDNNGYVLVKKEVVSGVQGYTAPATIYPVTVTCNGNTTTLQLSSDGTPQSVGGLAIGTSCHVDETSPTSNACPQGQTTVWGAISYSPTRDPSAALPGPTVTVTNRFTCQPGDGGTVQIKKVVINNTERALTGTYPINVTCNGNTTTLNLADQQTQSVGNLPNNSSCLVAEDTSALPSGQDGCGSLSTATWTTNYLPSNTLTTGGLVTVQNQLDCKLNNNGGNASLVVTKVVVNNIQGASVNPTYAVDAACGGTTTPLTLTPNVPQTISNITPGTNCEVVETEILQLPDEGACFNQGHKSPVWTTTVTPPIAQVNGPNTPVTVTNTLDCKATTGGGYGFVHVKKVVQNNTQASLSGIAFPVNVKCGNVNATFNLGSAGGNNAQGTVHAILLGTMCDTTETLPPAPTTGCDEGSAPAWDQPLISPPSIAAAGGTLGAQVTVTNVLNCKPKIAGIPPALKCPPPKIPSAGGKTCMCPGGTVERRGKCVETPSCVSPAKLNKSGTGCDCPQGMQFKGRTCVEKERKERKPKVTPGDVIRVIPGFGGGGGRKGGDDRRGGGGGGAGGGKGGAVGR